MIFIFKIFLIIFPLHVLEQTEVKFPISNQPYVYLGLRTPATAVFLSSWHIGSKVQLFFIFWNILTEKFYSIKVFRIEIFFLKILITHKHGKNIKYVSMKSKNLLQWNFQPKFSSIKIFRNGWGYIFEHLPQCACCELAAFLDLWVGVGECIEYRELALRLHSQDRSRPEWFYYFLKAAL